MTKLKKLVILTGMSLMAMLGLIGCKKETECAGCYQVKECDEYEIDGEDVWLCDDCHAMIEGMMDSID